MTATPAPAAPPAPPAPAWLAAIESGPSWMRWSAAALVGYTLFRLTPTGAASTDSVVDASASAVRLIIEGTAFLWAARRPGLPSRLVMALRISGWTSMGTALNYALLLPPHFGGPTVVSPAVDGVLTLAGYLAALAALLVYPRAPARAGQRAALAIDTVVTVAGLGLLSWVLVTQTTVGLVTTSTAQWLVRSFGLSQLALIAGLNVVVVRGLAVPSSRAFWWFIAGQALYLPVVALAQVREAGLLPSWPSDVVYHLGVLPTLVAAYLIRTDPMTPATAGGGPSWLRDLNPLPLVMPLVVGGPLLATLALGAVDKALVLAATLVAISLLLALRLLLSAHHTAKVAQAEAAREQRRQADRLQAVGRLAGGIAHEFNNLMARIVGHTELGEASLPPHGEAADHFVRARAAALRAANLTSQLLAFSGQQRTLRVMVDVDTVVHEHYLRLVHGLGAGIVPELQRGPGPCATFADEAQLHAALGQLVDNGVTAMPQGGRLTVGVRREQLAQPLDSTILSVPPGAYVVVSVADSGIGMTAEAIALACDPFYSTKSAHLGAGLGLASVHGVIAAHAGGLAIESAPGAGTTVRLYLPAA